MKKKYFNDMDIVERRIVLNDMITRIDCVHPIHNTMKNNLITTLEVVRDLDELSFKKAANKLLDGVYYALEELAPDQLYAELTAYGLEIGVEYR